METLPKRPLTTLWTIWLINPSSSRWIFRLLKKVSNESSYQKFFIILPSWIHQNRFGVATWKVTNWRIDLLNSIFSQIIVISFFIICFSISNFQANFANFAGIFYFVYNRWDRVNIIRAFCIYKVWSCIINFISF